MVRVYTFPECPYCQELKGLMISENIEFEDVNINLPENETEFSNIAKIAESEVVPIIKIGNKLLVPNRTFHTIMEGHLLIKKLLSGE